MKKFFSIFVAVLISVAMWGAQTYYYSGEATSTQWAKTAMSVSTDGFYEYIHITSTSAHQFKIGTSSNQWAYNYSYVTKGFNGTDVTEIGDYGSDNCYCWKKSAHYILVYYPSTTVNTTSNPIICASTTLPVFTYYMKNNWDDGDWTWREMTKDGSNYKLENVVFGGTGVNYNTAESETGQEWVAVGDILGDKIGALDTVTFVLNPSAGTVTATLLGKYVAPADPDYYLKNCWDGGDWSWKKMTKDGDNFKLDNVVFGGGGVNFNTSTSDADATWVSAGDFLGAAIGELDTVNLVLNPSAGTITATLLHASAKLDIKFVPGIWDTESPKFAAWIWSKTFPAGQFTSFFTPIKAENDTLHVTVIDAKADSIIFVRLADTTSSPVWSAKWNEAEKTKIDKVGLTYTITGWGEGEDPKSTGTWEAYIPPVPATFYVTGDSALVVDAGLTADKKWNAAAFKATTDTVVLKNLKANQEYNLKVTLKGAWEPASDVKGYTDLTVLDDGLSTKDDNNIKFTLNSASDVKVIYTGEVFKLLGDFKEPEFDPAIQQRLKLVPHQWSEANAKIAAYTWGKKIEGKWTGFFAGYNESDTLRATIRTAADSIAFVRFASDVEHPSWELEEEEGKVWNKIDKVLIDHTGLVYTIVDWSTGTWDSFIPATFYATGDSALVVDAGLDKAKAWNADAIKAIADTLVLKDLKAGQDYMLKVTLDGTWEGENNVKGYDELTEKADGLLRGKGDNNNNICFKLNTAGDVKIVYTSSLFKLIGDFYVKTYETKTIKLVPSEEWNVASAKFAAWTWGAEQDGKWTDFFTPVSAGNDTLKATIKTSADSIDFVRFSPKASEPSWASKDSSEVLIWGELKDTIDWKGLTASIVGWDSLTWKIVDRPCADFGLLVAGVYHKGKHNPLQTEWQEYQVLNIDLEAGQKFKVYNKCAEEGWVIKKYSATSYDNFDIPGDSVYVVKETGTYNFYLKIMESDEIYVAKKGHYTQSVPSQCEDVLMQAFFNESYNNSAPGVGGDLNLGNTKWNTLLGQASEIGSYFDLVWLPPSSNGSGMGYHPKEYSNQSSNWGSASELASLISALHTYDTKVVADVVINHCEGWTSWCDFPTLDFGAYGKFYPDASYICQNDEVNFSDAAGACKGQATGSYDDGENWDGARDWAHDMPKVQDMFKAYLQWLKNTVGYDGFRYDKGDGFNNWHHDNYNKAAGPYIAFMECYSGTEEIKWRIAQANYNLMALDFGTKWDVFNSFAGWNYGCYRGGGLLGQNWGRYAVEFIDSHDWFLRSDNENEFGGRGNSLTEALMPRLLAANAFLLSMPGVPCVFYPHWAKYKGFIKPMIDARKAARIHSESEVKDEYVSADGKGYQATIVGKEGGHIILCLGDKAHASGFDGYTLMSSYYAANDCNSGRDGSHQIWVKPASVIPTGVEEMSNESTIKAEKIMKDGKLFIRMGDKTFDMMGRRVK